MVAARHRCDNCGTMQPSEALRPGPWLLTPRDTGRARRLAARIGRMR